MAAVHYLEFVGRVLRPPTTTTWWSLCATFGWNLCSNFNNMKLSIFCPFYLITPIYSPKIGVSGGFHLQNRENMNETPKRHTLARVRVVWAIKVSSRIKIEMKKNRYNSAICTESPHGRICTKFRTAVWAAEVITCTKVFWWSVEGCGFCAGSNIALSHWQGQSPLTQNCS